MKAGIWPRLRDNTQTPQTDNQNKNKQNAKHTQTATKQQQTDKAQKQRRQTANKRPQGMQSPKHSWDRGGIACQTATVFEEWVQWEATVSKKKLEQAGELKKNENEHEPKTDQMKPT